MTVHFRPYGQETACGIGTLIGSRGRVLNTSVHPMAVTCEDCKSSRLFQGWKQRIPEVRGGPYRGA